MRFLCSSDVHVRIAAVHPLVYYGVLRRGQVQLSRPLQQPMERFQIGLGGGIAERFKGGNPLPQFLVFLLHQFQLVAASGQFPGQIREQHLNFRHGIQQL